MLLFWELKSWLMVGRPNVCDDSVSECDFIVSVFHFKNEMISEQHKRRSTLPPPKQAQENVNQITFQHTSMSLYNFKDRKNFKKKTLNLACLV